MAVCDDKAFQDEGMKRSGIGIVHASTFPFLQPVIQLPREQPTNTEHIDCRAHGAIAKTVFASAKFSRAMIDWNLDETITSALDERWNETMHAFEWH